MIAIFTGINIREEIDKTGDLNDGFSIVGRRCGTNQVRARCAGPFFLSVVDLSKGNPMRMQHFSLAAALCAGLASGLVMSAEDGGSGGGLSPEEIEAAAKAEAAAFIAQSAAGASDGEKNGLKGRKTKNDGSGEKDREVQDAPEYGEGYAANLVENTGVSDEWRREQVRRDAMMFAVGLEAGRQKTAQVASVINNAREIEKYLRGDAV
jgi:hypothetical protein